MADVSSFWVRRDADNVVRSAYQSNLPQDDTDAVAEDIYRRIVGEFGIGRCRLDDAGNLTAYSPPAPAGPPAVTFKADIWRRCTDAQAEMLANALSQRTVREQRMFSDAQQLVHSDADFLTLRAAVVGLLGQAEADRILAPSV